MNSNSDSADVVLAVDIGGTKILAGYVDRSGTIRQSHKYDMDRSSQGAALAAIERSVGHFRQLPRDGPAPCAIGMCMPGQVDAASGTWLHCMSIPIGSPVRLAEQFGDSGRLPVALDNDLNAAALAEATWGLGQAFGDFVYMSIGTGIAAGLFAGGRLVRGAANYAGEIGHMSVEPDGEPCVCGNHGCLENAASGGGMIARARARLGRFPQSSLHELERTGQLHSAAIFREALAGDELAALIKDKAVRALETGIVNVINLLNPEAFIIGGGVLRDEWLAEHLREHVRSRCMPVVRQSLRLFGISGFDVNTVGLLGAASVAWKHV
ncbi:ROK family protein [Paenibacillus cymbidii]|uniref:ROK family protein n=1 Tax=Paenibacillus cymbidii TaxID=1639034 RepID=UPI00143699C6|nr:ROK family protein [Paenibacillus cymbidii]